MSENRYRNIIFTNHALSRLSERGFTQAMAYETFSNSDTQIESKNGGTEFQKKFGGQTITVVAKQNEKYEWIILSCWIDPPLPGTRDSRLKADYKKYQKAGLWGKIFLTIKRQIFG